MKLIEFESLQEALDYFKENNAICQAFPPADSYIIDKKHGYRVKYIVPEKTDPYIDEIEPGTGQECISCISNKFKDTKSIVAPVYTPSSEKYDEFYRYLIDLEMYDSAFAPTKVCVFNGLFQAIYDVDRMWEEYQEFGFLIVSDMVYEHRKNALSILFSIMESPSGV